MQQFLSLARKPRSPIWHDSLSLRGPNLAAQVRLAGLAELALLTFRRAVQVIEVSSSNFTNLGYLEVKLLLKRDHVISRLDGRHALADGFHDPRALMAEHDGERALRILPRQCVGIWKETISSEIPRRRVFRCVPVWQTPV